MRQARVATDFPSVPRLHLLHFTKRSGAKLLQLLLHVLPRIRQSTFRQNMAISLEHAEDLRQGHCHDNSTPCTGGSPQQACLLQTNTTHFIPTSTASPSTYQQEVTCVVTPISQALFHCSAISTSFTETFETAEDPQLLLHGITVVSNPNGV